MGKKIADKTATKSKKIKVCCAHALEITKHLEFD